MSSGVSPHVSGSFGKRRVVIASSAPDDHLSDVAIVKSECLESQSSALVQVDDFYYGTFEGNGVCVSVVDSRKPLNFKCSSCDKKLKNNIRSEFVSKITDSSDEL